MKTTIPSRPGKVVLVAIVLFPALLAVSIAVAVWWHWHSETKVDLHPGLSLGRGAGNEAEMRDLLKKLTVYIGPRGWHGDEELANMKRTVALIEGTLSPRNFGYAVNRGGQLPLAGERWPAVWVEAKGRGDGTVLVAAPYDTGNLSVVALLVLAAELREAGLRKTVRFVFYPSELWRAGGGADPAFLEEGDPELVLCVSRLGGARQSTLLRGPKAHAEDAVLAKVHGFLETDLSALSNLSLFGSLGARGYEMTSDAEENPEDFESFRLAVRRLGELLKVAAGP